MKLFITGGAGFIGSNFIRYVLNLRKDFQIVNYDSLTYAGNLENLKSVRSNPKYTFIKGDIRNISAVESAMNGCDAVVHFAAESHVDRSISAPAAFIETNVVGTLNMLRVAKTLGVKRFVQISTDEVYGDIPEGQYATETFPIRPSSPYSASKAAADLLVLSYIRTYDFPGLITRSSNNYGPNQFPEKFLPLMITNALEDKRLPVYGDGRQQRDWLHVRDNCRAILKVLESGKIGEIYNIGGIEIHDNIDMVRWIVRELGKPESLITYVEDRLGHDRRYALNCGKIEYELGWKPQIPLGAGLPWTLDWYTERKTKRLIIGDSPKLMPTCDDRIFHILSEVFNRGVIGGLVDMRPYTEKIKKIFLDNQEKP